MTELAAQRRVGDVGQVQIGVDGDGFPIWGDASLPPEMRVDVRGQDEWFVRHQWELDRLSLCPMPVNRWVDADGFPHAGPAL